MNTPFKLPPHSIPANCIEFVEALSEMAKQLKIKKFSLKLDPSYERHDHTIPYNERIHGDLTINYSAEDGRGRPRYQINIMATTTSIVDIADQPDSSS